MNSASNAARGSSLPPPPLGPLPLEPPLLPPSVSCTAFGVNRGQSFAAVFFGFMWNLQNQISITGKLPNELLGAAPYLATIIAVAGFVGRVRPPAADGEPYVKG